MTRPAHSPSAVGPHLPAFPAPLSLLSRRGILGLAGAGALAALPALAACGAEKTAGAGAGATAAAANATQDATDSFPVSITHVYGTTTIESEPRRIATVSAVGADVVLALGVVPVGMPAVTFGADAHGAYPWASAALESLGAGWGSATGSARAPLIYDESEGLNLQALASLKPDLILGVTSAMTAAEYRELSAIAPTIAYPKGEVAYGTTWEEATTLIGRALGRSVAAEALVRTTSTEVTAAAARYPGLPGASYLALQLDLATPGTITLFSARDDRCRTFDLLGMKLAEVAHSFGADAAEAISVAVPASRASELEAEVVWAWISDGAGTGLVAAAPTSGAEEDVEGGDTGEESAEVASAASAEIVTKAREVFAGIPAVAEGSAVFVVDPATVMSLAAASPLSLPWFCDHGLPTLGQSVGRLRAQASASATPTAAPRR